MPTVTHGVTRGTQTGRWYVNGGGGTPVGTAHLVSPKSAVVPVTHNVTRIQWHGRLLWKSETCTDTWKQQVTGHLCVCMHTLKERAKKSGMGLSEPLKRLWSDFWHLALTCYSSRLGTANPGPYGEFEQLRNQALAVVFPPPSWQCARTLAWSGKDSRELADRMNFVLRQQLLALRQGSETEIKNVRFCVNLTRQREGWRTHTDTGSSITGLSVVWEQRSPPFKWHALGTGRWTSSCSQQPVPWKALTNSSVDNETSGKRLEHLNFVLLGFLFLCLTGYGAHLLTPFGHLKKGKA